MKIKMILPALTEAKSPFWRPIKYSLFPPLGLATLAAYCHQEDEVVLTDEHVEELNTDDEPDLVVIQVYITNAFRAYRLADHYRAKGSYVCLGGLHVTSLPKEAMPHANTIFLGPGEECWPRFLKDFKLGNVKKVYKSFERSIDVIPPIRRDLIKRQLYLVPNSEYPKFIIRFLSIKSMPALQDKSELIKGWIEVELAGVVKRFELCYLFSKEGAGNIKLNGSGSFCFSDFKLSPPRKLAGLVKIKDDFDVNFQLILRSI